MKDAEYEEKEGYTRLVNDITIKRTNQCEFRKDGIDYYLSYTPIRTVNGYLVVIYEAKKIYEMVNGVKKYTGYILVGILFCFVIFSIIMVAMNSFLFNFSCGFRGIMLPETNNQPIFLKLSYTQYSWILANKVF